MGTLRRGRGGGGPEPSPRQELLADVLEALRDVHGLAQVGFRPKVDPQLGGGGHQPLFLVQLAFEGQAQRRALTGFGR